MSFSSTYINTPFSRIPCVKGLRGKRPVHTSFDIRKQMVKRWLLGTGFMKIHGSSFPESILTLGLSCRKAAAARDSSPCHTP